MLAAGRPSSVLVGARRAALCVLQAGCMAMQTICEQRLGVFLAVLGGLAVGDAGHNLHA